MKAQIPFSIAANAEQFLLGIASEEAANSKDKEKAFNRLNRELDRIREKLRDSYDALIPNVLVANTDTFTDLIVNRICENPEKFYDNPATSRDIIQNFGKRDSKEYINLKIRINRLVSVYHKRLLQEQKNTNPIAELNELSKNLFRRTANINNDVSARVLGVGFGKNIRQVFGSRSVLAAIDPGLGSSSTTFVFFSSSFNSIGQSIREKVYTPLVEYLRNRLLGGYTETRGDITIGSIINLGHAALINEIGSYVNSPAFAKSLFAVAKGGSKKFAPQEITQAAAFFKKESKIVENKIEVTKSFTSTESGYGVLLALGVTFTNFEDAVINSDRGRRFEGPTARIIGEAPISKLSSKQKETVVQKLFRTVLRLNPVLGRSGKNLLEFIEDSLANTLRGLKTNPVKYKASKSVKYTKTTYKPINKNITSPFYGKVEPKTVKLNTFSVPASAINLSDILVKINASIHEQIKRNMGTGNSRNVLNYRTGRFAQSVKVERLSESRQGMITAFYSYMKNPYATFSEGGRQQFPRSRDPKLLISKSIREIAQTMVNNQLRAVNV